MRHLVWLVAVVCACSSKSKAPDDLGPCVPIDRDGAAYYQCERTGTAAERSTPELAAEKRANQARKDADEAMEHVARIETDLVELDRKLTSAVESITAAQTDADRTSAKAKLEQLRRDKAGLDQRTSEAKKKASDTRDGVKWDSACVGNPLAKGCP
jgi:hypothetical protein